jgi:regulator of cell morphogenesis and NO signaling
MSTDTTTGYGPETPIGELALRSPRLATVLDRLGLDYCCHGDRSLEAACAHAGLDPAAVLAELRAVPEPGEPEEWAGLDPAALCDHIEAVHHRYLHEELPSLDGLADKVESTHRDRHPELVEVRALVAALRADLEPHLAKEEQVLFPAIRALAGGARPQFPFGSIANPIRVMRAEHDAAGELLARLRSVTGDYRVPDDACASYRSLYQRLDALDRDTHAHIHKENNALFPAALGLAGVGTTPAARTAP